jgi:hypothetical protein
MKLFTISLTAATMAGYAAAGMDMQIDFPFAPVPVALVVPRASTQNLQVRFHFPFSFSDLIKVEMDK